MQSLKQAVTQLVFFLVFSSYAMMSTAYCSRGFRLHLQKDVQSDDRARLTEYLAIQAFLSPLGAQVCDIPAR